MQAALLLVVACLILQSSEGAIKNQGFDYPMNMPPPPNMWVEGFASRLHAQNIQKYETPQQVWQTWRLDQIMWNCIATYHPTALSALTKMAPYVRAPAEHHTSEARALCMLYAVNKAMPELIPISSDTISSWLKSLEVDSSILTDEDAFEMAGNGDVTPRVLGSVVAAEVLADMQTDGWNHKGTQTKDGKTCTANCRPFSDTTGYAPVNTPWEVTDPVRWQPLIESDDLGFFYAQEHVTAHIGMKAKPVVLSRAEIDARTLEDPAYDYEGEIPQVIANVAALDDFGKMMVEFMDNKINIAGGMIMRLREHFSLSLEAQVFYHYGYTSAEIDAVILTFKEKVRHDKIRPTSLVQMRGSQRVFSFANTAGHDAKDWTPYLRVMPHAEYPSGSGCICTVVAQYIDAFVQGEYNVDSFPTTWEFEKGSSKIQPGTVPAEKVSVTFEKMMDLRDTCGASRLWGGMHFNASVPDSYELCDAVGTKAYTDLMLPLLGTGSYSELMDDSKVKFKLMDDSKMQFSEQKEEKKENEMQPSPATSGTAILADKDTVDKIYGLAIACFVISAITLLLGAWFVLKFSKTAPHPAMLELKPAPSSSGSPASLAPKPTAESDLVVIGAKV